MEAGGNELSGRVRTRRAWPRSSEERWKRWGDDDELTLMEWNEARMMYAERIEC